MIGIHITSAKLPDSWPSSFSVLQEGGASVVELLRMTTSTIESLTPQVATVHCSAVWAFALKVLAFRQETPKGVLAVRPVEDAAIRLVLALTLKLTEATFKPLFLRLIDWAAQPPAQGKALLTPVLMILFPISTWRFFEGWLLLTLIGQSCYNAFDRAHGWMTFGWHWA